MSVSLTTLSLLSQTIYVCVRLYCLFCDCRRKTVCNEPSKGFKRFIDSLTCLGRHFDKRNLHPCTKCFNVLSWHDARRRVDLVGRKQKPRALRTSFHDITDPVLHRNKRIGIRDIEYKQNTLSTFDIRCRHGSKSLLSSRVPPNDLVHLFSMSCVLYLEINSNCRNEGLAKHFARVPKQQTRLASTRITQEKHLELPVIRSTHSSTCRSLFSFRTLNISSFSTTRDRCKDRAQTLLTIVSCQSSFSNS